MLQSRRSLPTILAFLTGCAASHVASALYVPPARAGTSPQRWEYDCVEVETTGKITETANRLGQEGWEMTAASGYAWANGLDRSKNMTWCFKRPLP